MTISKCTAVSVSASGQVSSTSTSTYHGYLCTVVTATGVINVRMGSSTGQIVDVIPAATAAGARGTIATGAQMTGGIYVEFVGGATGTLTILFE
jgi:hypothetical protein